MSDAKHSPLPFSKFRSTVNDAHGNPIISVHSATADSYEDAAFIVRACNSHYELIEALRVAMNEIEHLDDLGNKRLKRLHDVLNRARGEK